MLPSALAFLITLFGNSVGFTLLAPPSSIACGRSEDWAREPVSFTTHLTALAATPLQHEVYWLDEEVKKECKEEGIPLGESIAEGEVVVCLPQVATPEECNTLFEAGLNAANKRGKAARGRTRLSVSDPTAFESSDIVVTCEEVLLRVLDYLDENISSIYTTLFEPGEHWCEWQPLNAQLEQPSVSPDDTECDSLRELYMMGELEWSEGEPAINIYETNGYFGCHKDHLALTVLIPLTAPTSFVGGGTGFWSGNRDVGENPSTKPTKVLKPPPGSALVFGGDVTHAGMPVMEGYRSVFVCSFSTKTSASPQDRLHGLIAPPTTSANFKGSE